MQSRFFLTEITDDNQSFECWIRCGFKPILKGDTNLRREVSGDAQMPEREKKQHNKEKAVHKVTVAERAAVDRHFARRVALFCVSTVRRIVAVMYTSSAQPRTGPALITWSGR
jgi:hypothetical protein